MNTTIKLEKENKVMSNILEFKKPDDLEYITGQYNEPDIVGVKLKDISLQFGPDLHNFLIGDIEVSRDNMIAFIMITGLWCDIKDILKK